ncbi:mannitol/fructose-specific phosphotransferase system IIA component (Ntr-type) [Haloferula luteola]|uniref:Mannitol/fructose-specific phosphotransferase system IIA component (Ntr-type) n=1 Tax=Haloferula luteola TaxID=595692 RepID=A0A840UVC7_9BACT|nr:PTS sugar transporter subunit IIA [Haloferula luteola]MBB5350147.1 mannitol/fructose-specific phosphotransferase system IIA component (Ntr-type) [Haloferula luteola]
MQPQVLNNELQPSDAITVGELAAAFGWSIRFIEGLVRGERLPAEEIDGQLRFHRDEVVDWLQQKIHILDSAHVSELENRIESELLDNGTFRTHRSDRLASRLPLRGIALDLEIESKTEVLRALVEIAAGTGHLHDRDHLLASLIDREELCSTALPGGVAICHPRRPISSSLDRQILCALRTAHPIEFGAENGEDTQLFFLHCAPDDRSHLHGLARLARVLHHGGTAAFLAANDPEHFKETLSYLEAGLSR